jgi:anti-sigma regulatory factor (Ser/Thr protein kinase)
MKELTIAARIENLSAVNDFIIAEFEANGCPAQALMQIELAVEEIFVNIASYAYQPGEGEVTIRCSVEQAPMPAKIQFIDRGVPYNPLARDDPDTTLPAEERDPGGLGVMLVKKIMDGVEYEYSDGRNILTLTKLFR